MPVHPDTSTGPAAGSSTHGGIPSSRRRRVAQADPTSKEASSALHERSYGEAQTVLEAASTTGNTEVQIGEAYFSQGQPSEAVAAIERGLSKGGVTDPDEAHLTLGVARLRACMIRQCRGAARAARLSTPSTTEILGDVAGEHVQRHVAAAEHGVVEVADIEALSEGAGGKVALPVDLAVADLVAASLARP